MNNKMKAIKLILSTAILMMVSNVIFSQELHKVPVTSNEVKKFNERISKVNVHYEDGRVYIKWNITSNDADGIYTIEKSSDGVNFVGTGAKFMGNAAIGNPKDKFLSYSWVDKSPMAGISYYRFSKVEKDYNIILTDGISVLCPSTSLVINSSDK
jgi:hypothetical protein